MTTLEEISSCPVMNHAFWTEQARFHLALYREHSDIPNERRLQRAGFRKAMAGRRTRYYFDRLVEVTSGWPRLANTVCR